MNESAKKLLTLCVIGFVLLLPFLVGDGGCNFIGSAAPYPCPAESPVTVAYAIDGSIIGVQSLGKTHPGVLAAIQQAAGAGNYREVDINTSKTEPDDVPWVKAAWNALDRTKAPQWVASGPGGGWKSEPLPTSAAEATQRVKAVRKP